MSIIYFPDVFQDDATKFHLHKVKYPEGENLNKKTQNEDSG